ncbi:MAG: ABC transporter permease [Candidatus Limnocylindria bacterium]
MTAATYRIIRPRVRRRRHPIARWYRRNERTVLRTGGVLAFFVLYQVTSDLGLIDSFLFSSPLAIAAAGAREVTLPRFWSDLWISAAELGVGTLLAIVTAVPLGIAIGWYRRLSLGADPWLNFMNALPRAALVPLVVLWAGLGFEMKVLIVFLGGFFSIILPTVDGVRTAERQFIDVARSFRASDRLILISIVLPGIVPFIVSGMRILVGRVLAGVVIAEFYAQTEGIGVMVAKAAASLQMDRMLFGVLIFTIMGIVFYEMVGALERHFERWRPSTNLEEEA